MLQVQVGLADPRTILTPDRRTHSMSNFTDDDTPSERKQITDLERRGYDICRKTRYHVKIAEVNYFITTGTITIDPSTRHKHKGFGALLKLLEEKYPPDQFA